MLERALMKAKRGEEKKVSINYQVPSSLKEDFDKLCKDNNVSVTAMLNSLMEVALEEHQGLAYDLKSTSSLIQDLEKAEAELEAAERMIEQGDSVIFDAKDQFGNDVTLNFREIQKSASAKIGALRAELQKRGAK